MGYDFYDRPEVFCIISCMEFYVYNAQIRVYLVWDKLLDYFYAEEFNHKQNKMSEIN